MSINHIDTRHLRYFVAVAEELNFTRAAERLHIAQPPLTRQIQQLEIALNTQLFHRSKRKVTLTKAGQCLFSSANRLLYEMNNALLYAQSAAQGHVGELRIGINFSAPLYPNFPCLIAAYRQQYPEVRLIFKELFYADGIEALHDQTVDLCFTRFDEMGTKGKIQFHPFARDRLDLCLPSTHPLACKKTVRIADLKDDLFLLSPRQMRTTLFEELQKMARKSGFMLQLSQDTGHFPIMINLVAAGYGIAFLPAFMQTMAAGNVVFRKLKGLSPAAQAQPLMLAVRRDNQSVLLKNFLTLSKGLKNS